ncbi:MAG: hypothetical protein GW873_10115 [Nitrospirae bacterium]|nr:hypothetical protein [Nitrospirota bacterium]
MAVNQAENHHAEPTDEIDLIDYINVLCKWKKLIIFGTLSCVLIAGVASFQLSPVYRLATLIEIGTMEKEAGNPVVIEDPLTLFAKIKGGAYDEKIRKELNIKESDYPEIKVNNPKNTALIEFNIESSNRDRDQKILEAMNDLILKDHSDVSKIEKYNVSNRIKEVENNAILVSQEKEGLKSQLQLNKKNKNQIRKQIEDIASKISELEREKTKVDQKANPDNTLSLLLFSNEIQEGRRYYNQLQDRLNIDLEKEEETLKNQLNAKESGLNALMLQKDRLNARLTAFRDTRIVKATSSSQNPIGPSKRRIVFYTSIIAFTVFIFIAFFMEYLAKFKESQTRLTSEQSSGPS